MPPPSSGACRAAPGSPPAGRWCRRAAARAAWRRQPAQPCSRAWPAERRCPCPPCPVGVP
eukprot:12471064-Alexandrium_andersonii.AAC.1